MTEYPTVSVMTPVHNISEDDFTRAYKSLKTQTYDFYKIEWIVVIHDMDEEYIKKSAALPLKIMYVYFPSTGKALHYRCQETSL